MNRYFFPLYIIVVALTSCGGNDNVKEENYIVKVGTEFLTLNDLQKVIPSGLSKEDSVAFMNNYIDRWVDNALLGEVAAKNIPEMDKINTMVDEYRKELIIQEYRKAMILTQKDINEVSEDSIRSFYDKYKARFILTSPLVKGIYIKIADKAPNLDQIKKWMNSSKPDDLDKLEKYVLSGAVHYDYFRDRWVAWQDIEKNIPHYFTDPNNFVKTNKSFEVSENGFVYLLNISDSKQKGDIMPYDFAKKQIEEIYINANQKSFDQQLRSQLCDEALQSGDLVWGNNKKLNK